MDTDSALRELVDDVAYKLRVTADNPSAHGGQPGLIVVMNEQAGRLESILAASASQQSAPAGMVMVPSVCDGKEQEAFEAWAATEKYDMQTHPLHWLFLDGETHAAREGWAAALRYVSNMLAAAPPASPPTLNEAFDQVGAAMMREVRGGAKSAAQVADSKKETEYAKRLAVWLHRNHYLNDAPEWEPLDDLMGILTQIDNMVSGVMVRSEAAAPAVVVDEEVVTNAWRKAHYAFQVTGLEAGSGKGDAEKAAVSALAAALKGDA